MKPMVINSILEKKLEELEALRESLSFKDNDPNLNRKIVLQVLFAKTLLKAEISSRESAKKGEEDSEEMLRLRCMEKWLTELDEVFKTNQLLSGHDIGSVIEPKTGSLEINDGFIKGDTGSVYSWVESCLDEHTKEEDEAEPLFQDAEEKREVTLPAVAVEVVVAREVKEKGRLGFRALVCFGLIGLVGGMITLFGIIGDDMKEGQFFLTPT